MTAAARSHARAFNARGYVQASTEMLDGHKLYILIANDGSTIAYLDVPPGLDIDPLLTKRIGVRGEPHFNEDLGARLITVVTRIVAKRRRALAQKKGREHFRVPLCRLDTPGPYRSRSDIRGHGLYLSDFFDESLACSLGLVSDLPSSSVSISLASVLLKWLGGFGIEADVNRLNDSLAVEDDERGISLELEGRTDGLAGIQPDPSHRVRRSN